MQIKFQRSNFEKGMLGKSTHYRLSIQLQLTPEESALIAKYKLGNLPVHPDVPEGDRRYDKLLGLFIDKIIAGTVLEDEKMNPLLMAEEGLVMSMKSIMRRIKRNETFQGTTRVVEIVDDEAQVVAAA